MVELMLNLPNVKFFVVWISLNQEINEDWFLINCISNGYVCRFLGMRSKWCIRSMLVCWFILRSLGSAVEWRSVSEPARAAWLFSQELLERNRHLKSLYLTVDVRKERQQQDNALITFYKRPCIQWASPVIYQLKGMCACVCMFGIHVYTCKDILHERLKYI